MTVSVEYAQAHLADLLLTAQAGEEVLIMGLATVRLVPEPSRSAEGKPRQLGTLRGVLKLPENWEQQWSEMDQEIFELFESSSIFPNNA